jgi:hypothetical protein
MKKVFLALAVSALFAVSCSDAKKENEEKVAPKQEEVAKYEVFGEKFEDKGALNAAQMLAQYKTMKPGDTVNVKFASKINAGCKKKGCWMRLDLGEDQESFVRFKDYGFFIPLNADGKEVIVNGKAFVTEITVEELKHFAKDEGKSEAEIAKITEPEYTFAYESEGVLMK